MLKLIYTELGLHMHYEATSLETAIAQYVILNIRAGQSLHVEWGYATFLLPVQTPGLGLLELALRQYSQTLEVTRVDADSVEVVLQGTWMAPSIQAHEGMFLAAYDNETECLLHRLWHTAGQTLAVATSA